MPSKGNEISYIIMCSKEKIHQKKRWGPLLKENFRLKQKKRCIQSYSKKKWEKSYEKRHL